MITSIVTDAIDILPVMKKLILGHETGAFHLCTDITKTVLY